MKKDLYRKLNKALYNWGKALHPHYHVFQPIVEMGLLIVEQNAYEKYELPCVGDYQRSVYQVFEEAVKAAAAPQVGDISALANVGTKVIPCTWYPYYISNARNSSRVAHCCVSVSTAIPPLLSCETNNKPATAPI